MTPDPISRLIADCRALIATMGPVIDVLQTELAGGVGHTKLNAGLRRQNTLDLEAGHEGPEVPARLAPPAYR